MSRPASPSNVVVAAATVIFVVTIAAITLVAIAVEDGARATSLIGLIVAPLSTLIGIGAVLVQQRGTDNKIDKVAQDTSDLKNGVMEDKIRRVLVDLLPTDLTTTTDGGAHRAENGDTP